MPFQKIYPKMLTSSFTCEIVSFENRWESLRLFLLEYIGSLLKAYVDIVGIGKVSSFERFPWRVLHLRV